MPDKKSYGRIVSFVIPVIILLLTALVVMEAPGFSRGKKTVLDYYLALPSKYFTCGDPQNMTAKHKKSLIAHLNKPKGFIRAEPMGNHMEVALFIGKPNLIALTLKDGRECNKFALVAFSSDGTSREVTNDIFPKRSEVLAAIKGDKNAPFEIVLPKSGTTIKVVNTNSKKLLLNIQLSGGKFIIKK